jgi:histidinol-phosphate aminotransferase
MNIEELVRPNIIKLKPYTSARSENMSGVLLDANENSLGAVIEVGDYTELNRYPDPFQKELRESLGNYLGIPRDNLFCGVGSDEIIDLLIRIFCEPGNDNAVILEPTYGMYHVACDINNVRVKQVCLNEEFQIDVKKTLEAADEKSKLLFLCSPNNPTGNLLNNNDIITLAKEFKGIVIVDEAYIDFAGDETVIKETVKYQNLVVLRTFSKAWGLAGIRCGYCAASTAIIDLLFKIKAPYSVNKLTSGAVIKALDNYAKKEEYVSIINSEKERVFEKMKGLNGVKNVYNSDANFILFRCFKSKEVIDYLSDKGIIIRDRSGHPMLKDCLRISIGTKNENDLFLTGLWRALCEISS